ncbi:MAG: hypothetical protein BGN89_13870 [Alphaproteobacteria bacterium 64-6]|nr:MAG: hypothetical protein BGN89_13870 [Alphaproteobacteria bacterium 64-6]
MKQRFFDALGGPGDQWNVLVPSDEDFLARAADHDGYVISGSLKSVVDDAGTAFVDNVLGLIRNVHDSSVAPIVGVCFGSQAIAAALGGQVGKNPSGIFKLGVDRLSWSLAGGSEHWPETSSAPVIVQSHGECVLKLPKGSTRLASSSTIENEVFLVADRILGIQGHPEVDNHGLQNGFMPVHRPLFDDASWEAIERQARQPLHSVPLISLARRLLADGTLSQSPATETRLASLGTS